MNDTVEFCIQEVQKEMSGDTSSDEEFDFLSTGENPLSSEIQNYKLMSAVHTKHFDVLAWWKAQASNFPNLQDFVKSILCIPASSAPSERVFSKANNVVSKLRSRLSSERSKALTYLAENLAETSKEDNSFDWNSDNSDSQ